tara:strand:- start:2180 stop:3280 length:1101 start_codon:yes stop_codon:yes gene_type:complete
MSKARELAELGAVYDSGALSNRNLIINGGFQVFQRATSATAQTDGAFLTADRWLGFVSGGGAYTTQKSTGNTGTISHDTAWKIDVTTADTSLAAGDYYSLVHRMEAQNLQHLAYGTSNAKTLTLSFWVSATKTGTSCICVTKNDNTQYNYVAEYTINASNTWEHKTITIEPDSNIKAANGAITNDNGRGMQVIFVLAYGSNYTAGVNNTWNDSADFATTNQINHMDSTSNDFYITGVQLEVGTEATPFEHRSIGQELALCQRYYQKQTAGTNQYSIFLTGSIDTTSNIYLYGKLNGTMRTSPSFATANTYLYTQPGGTLTYSSTSNRSGPEVASINFGTISGGTQGYGIRFESNAGNGYVEFDAEL